MCIRVCVCVKQELLHAWRTKAVPTLHPSPPAVDVNGSGVVRVGGVDGSQEVEQRGRQLRGTVVRPLGEMKLQHCAGVTGHQLEAGGREGAKIVKHCPY